MTAEEGIVSEKGQVTIPIKLRRKFGIEAKSKLKSLKKTAKFIKKLPSFFDLAGSGAKEASVEEVKRILDEMRAEDA
jgi:bifunctional DNA-binding transcriptional regulator/antitoxin component of YhaV-PrlF toxin-antitoxin module